MLWAKAVLLWLAIVPLAIANGVVRERLLVPRLGARAARALSGVMLSLMVFVFTLSTIPWLSPQPTQTFLAVGLLWLGLTIAFEFGFGRLIAKRTWSELLRPYAFREGDLWVLVLVAVFLSPFLAAQLRATGTAPPVRPDFSITHSADIFTLHAPVDEARALHDVARALLEHAPRIRQDLGCDYRHAITVELFADQASMDRLLADPHVRGHYAHSGDRRIRMISPRLPIPHLDVAYETRVLIAVHEFAHLVNNEINPRMPPWLNEGVAVFVAPHAPYTHVCQHRFPFDRVPALRALQQSYRSVPAADLFAFTVVEFIATEFGHDALIRLLRAPATLESSVGVRDAEFEARWHQFMKQHYVSL